MSEPSKEELKEAKCRLYGLLLSKTQPTDAEVNVMYELVFDDQIRQHLAENLHVLKPNAGR